MPTESDITQNIEITTPMGKLAARGMRVSDIIATLTFTVVCMVAYGGWQHAEAARSDVKTLAEAIKENTKIQRDQVAAQREANCLMRLTPQERTNAREIEFCKQLGKER